MGWEPGYFICTKTDATLSASDKAAKCAGDSALTGAVRPQYRHYLACRDFKREIKESAHMPIIDCDRLY